MTLRSHGKHQESFEDLLLGQFEVNEISIFELDKHWQERVSFHTYHLLIDRQVDNFELQMQCGQFSLQLWERDILSDSLISDCQIE